MSAADQLLAALRQAAPRRKQIAIDQVWAVFRASVRGFTADLEARPVLACLLSELEEHGALALPRSKHLWDGSIDPPLPAWVKLERARPHPSTRHREIAWPPEMAFVSALPRVSNLDEILAIRDFLAGDNQERPMVPVRERSVELFGDEKRLDALLAGALFRPGRLSIADLRCFEVAPPVVWDPCPNAEADSALVIENLHTYDSFRRWNRTARHYRAIAYGSGDLFKRTVRDIPRLLSELGARRVEYFGDLDARGLAIAHAANAWLKNQRLSLEPAEHWYAALIERAGDARLQGAPAEPPDSHLCWLPADLRKPARALLAKGWRAPQELIGWEHLSQPLP